MAVLTLGTIRRSRRLPGMAFGVLLAAGCSDVELEAFAPGPDPGRDAAVPDGDAAAEAGADATPPDARLVRVIDDFEDGDTLSNEPGGWWYPVNDGTGFQDLRVESDTVRPEHGISLRTAGAGFSDWGAAIGVGVAGFFGDDAPEEIRFLARAEAPREVSFHALDGSGQHFTRTFQLTTEWQSYSAYFDQMFAIVDGRGVAIDVATVYELQWFFFLPEPFDFWIDDVILVNY